MSEIKFYPLQTVWCKEDINSPLEKGKEYIVEEHDPYTHLIKVAGHERWYTQQRFEAVAIEENQTIADGEEQLENTDRYKTNSGKQLFDVMKDDIMTPDEYRGFLKGNALKYIHRYRHKGGIKSLEKAIVNLQELIKFEKERNEHV